VTPAQVHMASNGALSSSVITSLPTTRCGTRFRERPRLRRPGFEIHGVDSASLEATALIADRSHLDNGRLLETQDCVMSDDVGCEIVCLPDGQRIRIVRIARKEEDKRCGIVRMRSGRAIGTLRVDLVGTIAVALRYGCPSQAGWSAIDRRTRRS